MIENKYLQLNDIKFNINYGITNEELNSSLRYNNIVSNDTSYNVKYDDDAYHDLYHHHHHHHHDNKLENNIHPYHRNLIRCFIYIIFYTSLIFIIVIFYYFRQLILNNDMQCINTDHIVHNYNKNNNNNDNKKFIHKVILFGDSLISRPTVNFNINHNIYNKIILKYQNLNFNII